MTGPADHNEGISAPERLGLINDIARGSTPLPFSTMAIGEVRDEPTQFDIFALYFPNRHMQYELISISGNQVDKTAAIRQQIIGAELNPDSVRAKEAELARFKASGQLGFADEIGDGRNVLGMFGFPLLMVGFGHRVSDGSEATFVFHPAHIEPTEALEELKQVVRDTIQEERF